MKGNQKAKQCIRISSKGLNKQAKDQIQLAAGLPCMQRAQAQPEEPHKPEHGVTHL